MPCNLFRTAELREVIRLRDVERLTWREIASQTGRSKAALMRNYYANTDSTPTQTGIRTPVMWPRCWKALAAMPANAPDLANAWGVSPKTAANRIRELKAMGLVVCTGRGPRKRNLWDATPKGRELLREHGYDQR